jgi:hypothetical protein
MYVGRIFLGEDVINQVSTASLWIYSLICVVIKEDVVFVDGRCNGESVVTVVLMVPPKTGRFNLWVAPQPMNHPCY